MRGKSIIVTLVTAITVLAVGTICAAQGKKPMS